ncbi:MAG: hypothetical protein WC584_00500 [Candidatus Pacearchaeota archaeon]
MNTIDKKLKNLGRRGKNLKEIEEEIELIKKEYPLKSSECVLPHEDYKFSKLFSSLPIDILNDFY